MTKKQYVNDGIKITIKNNNKIDKNGKIAFQDL